MTLRGQAAGGGGYSAASVVRAGDLAAFLYLLEA